MSTLAEAKTEAVKTDVLVLGGGIAGCMAAIRAREDNLDVVLVDKGNLGRSGLSYQMSGVHSYFDPEKDDYSDCYRECVEGSQWLADQERLNGMLNETTELIRGMESWGVQFQKQDGEFIRTAGVGMHYGRNVLMVYGGFQMMSIIRAEVLRRGVRVIERVMSTDLLTSDGELPTSGRVVGAVGFHIRTGKFYTFRARATVIATGGTNLLWGGEGYMPSCSGDGQAMAFRAGGEMRNHDISFFRYHPTGLNCAPGAHALLGEGVIMVNARGERFMKQWDPLRVERATAALVCRAMAVETKAGRGPIYWDARHLNESSYGRLEKTIPIVLKSLALKRLDFRKDRIPYSCALEDLGPGGLRVDRENATSLPALYCAGATSDHSEDGVSNVINHGTESGIGGNRAGKAAAAYCGIAGEPVIDERQAARLKEQIFAPLRRESGIKHQAVRRRCMDIIDSGLLGPVRNGKGLEKAIGAVQEIIEEQVPGLVARDYHELTRCLGVANALLFLEFVPRCALMRTESRGSHYREDYPARDDANWLKWVIAKKENNNISVWAEPIPYENYPLKYTETSTS